MELAQLIIRVALAVVFVVMGIAHFLPGPARGMSAMIPPSLKRPGLPCGKTLVRFTGLCEIAGGVGLLIPQTQTAAAIALVAFLVAVFPANAYAAADPERFGTAAIPFWPRFTAQVALIGVIAFTLAPAN